MSFVDLPMQLEPVEHRVATLHAHDIVKFFVTVCKLCEES